MKLLLLGCNHRTAPVAVRERLSLSEDQVPAALGELLARFGGEAAALNTCNRLEMYLADTDTTEIDLRAYIAKARGVDEGDLDRVLYCHRDADAVRHLFRVSAGLDSLVVGEGQISGQVKRAYELANEQAATGPMLHALFQQARVVAKRVRRETGIARGHASISTVAIDFVREVFDHFTDKTVLVIGAGKMGRLTLNQLKSLGVAHIMVANRSADKAAEVARACGGRALEWEHLDEALSGADIVISTTGATEPIVTAERMRGIMAKRHTGPLVVIDIAVPRDFDPAVHDGDRVCLFNIDDLQRVCQDTLSERRRHVPAADAIVEQETARFAAEWGRRRTGPAIARLTADFDRKRHVVLTQLMNKLNGRLTEEDRKTIEGAFRLLQNQFLHGPISALGEESRTGGGALLEALRQLFRIKE